MNNYKITEFGNLVFIEDYDDSSCAIIKIITTEYVANVVHCNKCSLSISHCNRNVPKNYKCNMVASKLCNHHNCGRTHYFKYISLSLFTIRYLNKLNKTI